MGRSKAVAWAVRDDAANEQQVHDAAVGDKAVEGQALEVQVEQESAI